MSIYMGIDPAKEGEDKTAISYYYKGYRVIVNDIACIHWEYKQWYFPMSKKKRIQKKFKKKEWCFGSFNKHYAYVTKESGEMIVSQKTFDMMKKHFTNL